MSRQGQERRQKRVGRSTRARWSVWCKQKNNCMLQTCPRRKAGGGHACGGLGRCVSATNLWNKPEQAGATDALLGKRLARWRRRDECGGGLTWEWRCRRAARYGGLQAHEGRRCSNAQMQTATAKGLRRRLEGRRRASQRRPMPVDEY
jgi:hypothetical protein